MARLHVEGLEERLTPATLPTGFADSTIISGLTSPTSLVVVPDGRLLITQQGGAVRVVQNGALLAAPAISLAVNSSGERGLLGVDLDPSFATNQFVYVYYTQATGNLHRVSRFTMTGNSIDPASEVVLLTIPDSPGTSNHNGGAVHFGGDGKLYIAVGDDGTSANSQSLNVLNGKILRINADGSIPTDNPFFGSTSGSNRAIWALGLRNPYTFSIQAGTGRAIINDVGQNAFEEVDPGAAGRNYGWPSTEGSFDQAAFPGFTEPLFAYPHVSGTDGGFAITGGTFYPANGSFPADSFGDYFFADLTNNWIRRLDPATNSVELFASNLPAGTVDLDVQNGNLLVLSYNTGSITRISFPAGQAAAPNPLLVGLPQFAAGSGGAATLYNSDRSVRFTASPFEASFTGGVRTAVGDFNGDGIGDLAVGSGPGRAGNVRIFNGVDQSVLFDFIPFGEAFTLGINVSAGDITGDGRAELAVTPEDGGGARVRIFSPSTSGFTTLADFYALENPDGTVDDSFRGGGRTAIGDINGDGFADLAFAAGFGGGPRIALFNGHSLAAGAFLKLRGDFFAFESRLRNGTFLAVGDFDGDGLGDLAVGAGSGGSPRVSVFGGAALLAGVETRIRDFFGGDSAARNGILVAVKNLDGDGLADLLTGNGPVPGRITGYAGAQFFTPGLPGVAFDLEPFPGFNRGISVG